MTGRRKAQAVPGPSASPHRQATPPAPGPVRSGQTKPPRRVRRVLNAVVGLAEWIPRWSSLRALHGRELEWISKVAVVACPAIAIGFNYVESLDILPHTTLRSAQRYVPLELVAAYMVAVPYAAASILYDLACPSPIKAYESSDAFVARFKELNSPQEQTRLALHNIVRNALGEARRTQTEDSLNQVLVEVFEETTTAENTWDAMNTCRAFWRLVVTLLYLASIALSLVLLLWTTPRHVFHVSSPLDVLRYLFGD